MSSDSHFPPIRDEKVEKDLLRSAAAIMEYYCNEEIIFPLLITNKEQTCKILDRAGTLYQCTLTSIRLLQYHRALLYLCALKEYCANNLSFATQENAEKQLDALFLNGPLFPPRADFQTP